MSLQLHLLEVGRPRIRRSVAMAIGPVVQALAPLGGHAGTSLPGLIAERVDPAILSELAEDLGPIVLVAGTNGKTTTTRLLTRIVTGATGSGPISNPSGANLRQGIVTALLRARQRRSERPQGRAAVLEVDELALPSVAIEMRVDAIVMTNVFRDQLDRYGETDQVLRAWHAMLADLPMTTRLVVCGDDSRLVDLSRRSGRPTITFGMDAPPSASEPDPGGRRVRSQTTAVGGADPVACRECGSMLTFTWRTIGHLGDYRCPNGHVRRAIPDIRVAAAPNGGDAPAGGSMYRFGGAFGSATATAGLEGAAGAYDCAAAVAAAVAVGIDPLAAIRALDGASAAFGRLERTHLDGRHVVLALVKNPTSMTESVRMAGASEPDGVLIALNDEAADGRDVSWIWDVALDRLRRVPVFGLTGSRADDLAVRLKYDGLTGDEGTAVDVDPNIDASLARTIGRIRPGGTLVVLATYTALLAIRSRLERLGVVAPIPR